MYDIRAVRAARLAGVVVNDAEFLYSPDNKLEVNLVVVALAALCRQLAVGVVLDARHEIAALNVVPAFWQSQQAGLCEPLEQGLPLRRILLVLQVEVHCVDRGVGICAVISIAPLTAPYPCLGLGAELLVGVILSVVTLRHRAERCQKGASKCDKQFSHNFPFLYI